VTAVLGPTNTGKTHLAIERMLAHSSGVIGLPLRLLAREVYNKIADRAGADVVALITGEEKIKPPNPRFWVATIEAMPRDLDVAFVAIDEIQIASDLERGHVFTDRILHRRGRDETLILGAATMRPVVERLLPGASVVTRPRLSQLTYAGDRKLTRQPRRTAIVAFSADEVYAIAELIRRQHGGAAVVLGALSPRTRNAQVSMYQSGDVDYLVATDAIGMGLNLDVDHVAFASDRKYDGYQFRRLSPAEFAQIAGRAGRATRDGTFGTTGRCPPFELELVNALQNHSFDSVKILQWRNSNLDFTTLGTLQATLSVAPSHEALTRAPAGEDVRVLDHVVRDEDVRAIAHGREAVRRLWEVCQLPDYRKIAPAAHAELVAVLYGYLMRQGNIPADWFAAQVAQADRIDGDIDTLSARIAQIRTWTFAANQPDWLADSDRWREEARSIEDRLSDALHERLTERFVDRRTSLLMRRLRENTMLETEIGKTGDVIVEGHVIGRLDGFMFAPDAAAAGTEAKALQAAAQKALAGEIDARAERLANAPDDQFVLASDGLVRWIGDAVGRLTAADDALRPRVTVIADERLSGAPLQSVQARLDLWLGAHIGKVLAPLFELTAATDVTGIARGIAFQVVEALGVLDRHQVATDLKTLDQSARAMLRKYGVRFGAYHVYVPALLKPAPRALASLLWGLKHQGIELGALADVQHLAASGRTSITVDKNLDRDAYRVLGYRVCGDRAVRVDILERLADLIRPALAWRTGSVQPKPPGAFDGAAFTVTQAMTSLTGAAGEDFASILRALGYRMERRPKLPEPDVAVVTADATAPVEGGEAAAGESHSSDSAPSTETEPDAAPAMAADAQAVPVEAEHAEDASPGDAAPADAGAPQDEAPPETATTATDASVSDSGSEPTPTDEQATAGEQTSEQIATASDAPAEPELVEVWRPGRPPEERRSWKNRRDRAPAVGRDAAAEGEGGPHRSRHRHGGKGRRHDGPPGEGTAPEAGTDADASARKERDDSNNRRFGRPGDDGKDQRGRGGTGRSEWRNKGRGGGNAPDRAFGGQQGQSQGRSSGRPQRGSYGERPDRPIDPDSPFAKLAALKAQLEASAKDRE
jgi:ATP-dependent RNA helicase SUPV3L1/SUV3